MDEILRITIREILAKSWGIVHIMEILVDEMKHLPPYDRMEDGAYFAKRDIGKVLEQVEGKYDYGRSF